jgi:hypothetical protein
MPDWGGQRPGAGRKPKVPGQLRVTLSTRISEASMARLKALSHRENKPLGQLLDEMLLGVDPAGASLAPVTADDGPESTS